MKPELRRVVEVGDALEALVKRGEPVDGAFALKRYQKRIIRVQRASAIRDDVENAGHEVFGLLSKESNFPVVKPAPHSCDRYSQIRWCCLSLHGTSAKHRQRLKNQEVDEDNAVPFVLESRCEVYSALVQRVIGVEQSDDNVGVENDVSHRRVRRCRLPHLLARRERRR